MTDQDCAICLVKANSRGGEFLVSPGCCGKWFHQACIQDMRRAGKNFCPTCRTPFPGGASEPPEAPVPIQPVIPGTSRSFLLQEIQQHHQQTSTANAVPTSARSTPVSRNRPPLPFLQSIQQPQQLQQQHVAPNPPVSSIPAPPPLPPQPNVQNVNVPPPRPPPPAMPRQVNSFNASPSPAPTPVRSSSATGIFARLFGGRSSASSSSIFSSRLSDSPLEEDEITPLKASQLSMKLSGKPEDSTTPPIEPLTITLSPEYEESTISETSPFHVRVSTVFNSHTAAIAERKTTLDVVCVLDVSGSMSGSKIQNLKTAMEFVVNSLGENDRLSIVTFNDMASPIQGMWKMTSARKEQSKRLIQSIDADGGTSIYEGMKHGWSMIENRKTMNQSSCMFLLTDGQDGSFLEEKKQLAQSIRAKGTSFFVFGFGNDHDAPHLIQIANAAEGSFVYVETNDTVIDAFGGAIGSQQGQLLKDVSVHIQLAPSLSASLKIEKILCGSYSSRIDPSSTSGSVTFADLFGGERRDFLIQLKLPAIPDRIENYPLIAVHATYRQYNSADQPADRFTTNPIRCSIRRVPLHEYHSSQVRDIEVDAQIQRLHVTNQMKEAMTAADANQFEEAKRILSSTKSQLLESISYRTGHGMMISLLDDLKDCEKKVASRTDYEYHGGKAFMTENMMQHSKQRMVYAKKSASPGMFSYQPTTSITTQTSAFNYKMSMK